MTILLIEDDQSFLGLVKRFLEREGFKVLALQSVKEVIEEERYLECEMIILDLMFQDGHGMDLVRLLKKLRIDVPLLVMSGVDELDSKLSLLDAGADDYLTKPINPQELLARIYAILRRFSHRKMPNFLDFGELAFCNASGQLMIGEQKIDLRPKEASLLRLLLKNRRHTVKSEVIFEYIWPEREFSSSALTSLVKRLRGKLGEMREVLETVYGIGYRVNI